MGRVHWPSTAVFFVRCTQTSFGTGLGSKNNKNNKYNRRLQCCRFIEDRWLNKSVKPFAFVRSVLILHYLITFTN